MAYATKVADDKTTTYKLRGGYDKTTITFAVRDGGAIVGKSVLVRHHTDPRDPSKFVPHFNLTIDGYETQVHCNVWVTPEFAAKVWTAFTKPLDPISTGALAWVRVED